jgi:protoheme IX farnesyltransferase
MTELAVPRSRSTFASVSRDYLELSKARIVMMVLITTASGFLAANRPFSLILLVNTLVGTALVAAGTNALNQYMERTFDAKMRRTRLRPLPDGRISPQAALVFSAGIAIIGSVYLALAVNVLTAVLGIVTLSSYIFIYTPLKRISTLCTLVGAIPGAIPPLMGWTAARGSIGAGGLILFGILFFWQMPHFMAISWIYREDYGQAGFAMTSVKDGDGRSTGLQAVLYTFALIAVSVAPSMIGMAGWWYLVAAVVSGVVFLVAALGFQRERTTRTARKLFMTSNIYLLIVMTLLVIGSRA